jgi:hypothetical protein
MDKQILEHERSPHFQKKAPTAAGYCIATKRQKRMHDLIHLKPE